MEAESFQFSMRRMFCAVAFFSVAAWLARAGVITLNDTSRNDGGTFAYFTLIGCAVFGIAGIGAIAEKRIARIVRPLVLLVLLAVGFYASVVFRMGDLSIIAVVLFWLVGKYPLGLLANLWRRRRIRH